MTDNFHEDDPETIIHVRLLAWHNKFEKCKAFKKDLSKELVPGVWHPTTWWDWCMSEDEKKIWTHFLLIKLESGKS